MDNIVNLKTSDKIKNANTDYDLVELTNGILFDLNTDILTKSSFAVPIAELVTLGAGVSSLIPALHTVTQTITMDTQGLYRLANAGAGDTLKIAKNGNFWGAFKTVEGSSKFAQLQSAGPISATSTTTMPIDPATAMMAIALFTIEQRLDSIMEMEKQIKSFLEMEKQSEIEADVHTLVSIITKYKYNWNNSIFMTNNHKMVLDIQRTEKKNMLSFQKKVVETIHSKKGFAAQSKLNASLVNLEKDFTYYKLSLYAYAMASLIEILLSGNFKEENISLIKKDIETCSLDYRKIYTQCSIYLESLQSASIEANILKGVGTAGMMAGKIVGNIPLVRRGPVDEFLQDSGEKLKNHVKTAEKNIVCDFGKVKDPETSIFVEKMDDLIQIYNHTSEICFDDKKIYLITG